MSTHAKTINLAAVVDEPTALTAVPLALITILVVITAVVFGAAAEHEFLNFGDDDAVTSNAIVQSGLNTRSIHWAFTTTRGGEWHPLTWLSHELDCSLFELNAAGPHMVNIILHVASAVTLFVLLNRMTASLWPSFVAALLFALHPLRLEPVAWLADRKDVLATFAAMLTCWFYVAYVRSGLSSKYALSLLFFVLGLLAGQTIVMLPIALLLLDVWPLGRTKFFPPATLPMPQAQRGRMVLLEKIPFAILAIAAAVIAMRARHMINPMPVGARLVNAIQSCGMYVVKLLAPVNLAIFYPFPRHAEIAKLASAMVVLLAISALVLWQWRKMPWLAVGWLWYLVTILPMLGIVQIGEAAMADRYTYIPHIGLMIAIVWTGAAALRKQPHPAAVLASLAVAACALGTIMQIGFWENSTSVFQHALAVTRDNDVAHDRLGVATGDANEFATAVKINPLNASAHCNLGRSFVATGRSNLAPLYFNLALAIDPTFAPAYFNWGVALARLGKPRDAIDKFRRATGIDPYYLDAYNELGLVLLQQKDYQGAAAQFSTILSVNPESVDAHYNLAVTLDQSGKLEAAIAEYRAVLALKSDHEQARARLQALKRM